MGERLNHPYLKYKNWKNIEDEQLDKIPQHLSMKSSARYGNSSWVPRDKYYGGYDSPKWHQMSVKINRYLKSNIGKPYNEVYSEFKKKFPKDYCGVNLNKHFKFRFVEYDELDLNWRSERFCYYIDDQGNIQNVYLDKIKQSKPKKKLAATISCKRKMYRFSDFIVHNFHANFIVHCYLPRHFDQLLNGNLLSEEIFWRMVTYISKNSVLQAIRQLKSEKWWDEFRRMHHMRWCKDVMLKFMFDERDEEVVEYVEVGSPEHKRFIAENSKQAKIEKKKREKEALAKLETLLRDIEYERKHKDDDKNIINRDRLGFNENSFKGEGYHGQKRKRKRHK